MNIVIIATQNYGRNFSANNTKCEFIALGLKSIGCKVTILNQILGVEGNISVKKYKSNVGIDYIDFPLCNLFTVNKNLKTLRSILDELYESNDLNHIIVGFTLYPLFLSICRIAKKCNYSRSTLFHEWHIGIKNEPIYRRLDYFLIDNLFGYSIDYIFPISRYLERKARHFNCPMMILPVMSSYKRNNAQTYIRNYFSFCANGLYLIRNSLILEAFKIIVNKYPSIQLKLILFGNDKTINDVRNLIFKLGIQDNVQINIQIPQDQLFEIYDKSIGLLIPLKPDSIQDKARFSQKIAEYVGSKRPIITSSVGEIPYYFKHKESAMLAKYTTEDYAHCMEELILDPLLADCIGQNGYKVGIENFDFIVNAKRIVEHINK